MKAVLPKKWHHAAPIHSAIKGNISGRCNESPTETCCMEKIRSSVVRIAGIKPSPRHHGQPTGHADIQKDVQAARNFNQAAEESGVKRIIYLGGLGEMADNLSEHLRSRQSEQYLTSFHTFSHFFRQIDALPQWSQILVGRFSFLILLGIRATVLLERTFFGLIPILKKAEECDSNVLSHGGTGHIFHHRIP